MDYKIIIIFMINKCRSIAADRSPKQESPREHRQIRGFKGTLISQKGALKNLRGPPCVEESSNIAAVYMNHCPQFLRPA